MSGMIRQQQEQREEDEWYDKTAAIERPGDASFLESILPRTSADVRVSRRRIVTAAADVADLLVPVEAATTDFATGRAASITTVSSAGSGISPTSRVRSASAIESTPANWPADI